MSRSRGLRAIVKAVSIRRTGPDSRANAEPAKGSNPEPTKLLVLIGDARPAGGEGSGPGWAQIQVTDLESLAAPRTWREVVVVAESVAELRGVLPWLELAGRARRTTLSVRGTDRAGRLRPPTAISRHAVEEARLSQTDDDRTRTAALAQRVQVRVREAVDVADVARAALSAPLSGGRAGAAAGLRLGITSFDASWWAAGDPSATLLTARTETQDVNRVPAFDLLISAGSTAAADPILPRVNIDERMLLPPVDTAVCSPVGFCPAGDLHGELSRTRGGAWLVRAGGAALFSTDATTGLTENHVRALRPLRFLRLQAGSPDADARGLGRLLSQLCCAGVPVSAPRLPAALTEALGPDIAERVRSLDPSTLADPVTRDVWSLRTRRLALRRFSGAAYWAQHVAIPDHALLPAPSVSVLLATRRPALLPFALAQIARQDWAELEVVVVLHGASAADPAVRDVLAAYPRPISAVEAAPDLSFGQVLNAGLARCSGRLVTKADDDDWYGPHHVTDLVQAHGYSGATLVGAAGYYVYLAESDVTVRFTNRPTESANRWVVGATNLVATADLLSVGGWRSLAFGEDATLYRAVQAAGGSIYGTHDLGFTYFRGRDHTWTPAGGDSKWLDDRFPRVPGFHPPPEVDPLPHPLLAGR